MRLSQDLRLLSLQVSGKIWSSYGLKLMRTGNDDDDACKDSPASLSTAITVGASTILDERAYFSNKGKCVGKDRNLEG